MNSFNKIIVITLILITNVSYSQLKIDNLGHVGIGTNYPNTGFQSHIIKNLLISNVDGTPFNQLYFTVGNGSPGAEISTSNGTLAFWSPTLGYNNLNAKEYYRVSDSTLKSNINNIENGLSSLMKLRPVLYDVKNLKQINEKEIQTSTNKEFGFLSQDVEKLFPGFKITEDLKGVKLMDYDQIIPLAVKSIQEQQMIIESLKTDIKALDKKIIDLNERISTSSQSDIVNVEHSNLNQNKPNPFKENTTIGYSISNSNFRSASILIFDMTGSLLKTHNIRSAGEGVLIINGGDLKPGKYLYSLVVNEKEIDSKSMILLGE